MVRFLVGIDEAGRGPLAGPVAVGVVIFFSPKISTIFKRVKDSKKLSARKREYWFEIIQREKMAGRLDYKVSFSSEKTIDRKGITKSIQHALEEGLRALQISKQNTKIFLDGGLKAPKEYKNQETIIKGDEKITVISLASIVAKVLRDKKMKNFAKKYKQYGFEIHKGYGTAMHKKMIKKFGQSPIQRKSFRCN